MAKSFIDFGPGSINTSMWQVSTSWWKGVVGQTCSFGSQKVEKRWVTGTKHDVFNVLLSPTRLHLHKSPSPPNNVIIL